MKPHFLLLVVGASVFPFTAIAQQGAGDSVQALYQQGLEAVRDGEVEAARAAFSAVLERNPRHANARYRLRQLELDKDKLEIRKRELAFSRVRIPEVDFDGASLDEALETLGALVERESDGEFAANFIVRDPAGQLADRQISIQLRGVPANVVLRYIAEQAGAVVRFDKHAILISPPSSVTGDHAATDEG